ncbi:hypothetical protein SADUNF_Sadunf06G0006600 [Salix dunnii]|uniref:Uncharacterized protein n=1 Tax=Salix dunnii TaxID=1413687 RepID=A0A835MUH4_9ROSI|nr:hypothetical protein SADUNF_Sadunf06G0006600 [Salix dunnii]
MYLYIAEFRSRTLEPFWWVLATVNEDLKSNGYKKIDVEKLSLDSGAEAQSSVQVYQTLKNWAALILGTAADTNVDEST